MAKRVVLVIMGALVITLLSATVAIAGWTPEDIYDDYATHGKLTRDYTEAELLAYLNDASLAQYGDTDLKKALDAVVKDRLDRTEIGARNDRLAERVAVEKVGDPRPGEVLEFPSVGQVIDDDDVVAAARVERVDQVRSDESGPAGDDEHGQGDGSRGAGMQEAGTQRRFED